MALYNQALQPAVWPPLRSGKPAAELVRYPLCRVQKNDKKFSEFYSLFLQFA